MTVSYKSDFTPRYNNLYLIINHLSNWYYTKYPENLWKIILPVKLGLGIIYESKSISAYINKTQWQDPTYGTKDNPMPIFFKRALSGFECAGGVEDYIYIKTSVYKKFVEIYLAHGLEPEEFDRLYGADMKRLGLTD